jgi:hypothetical protein
MIPVDNDDELDVHLVDLLALADTMRLAAGGADPRELFYAAAILMSWALARQNDAVRSDAIDTALDIIRNGQKVFAKDKSPRFDA